MAVSRHWDPGRPGRNPGEDGGLFLTHTSRSSTGLKYPRFHQVVSEKVLRLLKRKRSWWLADAQKLADDYPYTFHKPSYEVVQMLKPEDEVKLIFRFDSDDPEAPNAERMWVQITKKSNREFEGVLHNEPAYIKDLKYGELLTFKEKHIIQVSIDDPVPSKTDKYLPRCFVTQRIMRDGQKIGYLYREEPDREEDSGWRFMCGDESDEYMDDVENICLVSLGAVLSEDDRILDLLDEPIGTAFEFDDSKGKFVPSTD